MISSQQQLRDDLITKAHSYRASPCSQHEPTDGVAVTIAVHHHSSTAGVDGDTCCSGAGDALGTLPGGVAAGR